MLTVSIMGELFPIFYNGEMSVRNMYILSLPLLIRVSSNGGSCVPSFCFTGVLDVKYD